MDSERLRIRRVPPAALGPMLGAARLRAGFRLREFARRVELSHPYVIQLEAGVRCPSVTVAARLAEELALTEDERALLLSAAVDDAGRDHPARHRDAVSLAALATTSPPREGN